MWTCMRPACVRSIDEVYCSKLESAAYSTGPSESQPASRSATPNGLLCITIAVVSDIAERFRHPVMLNRQHPLCTEGTVLC